MRRFGAHYAHKRRYLPDAAQLLSLCSGMSRTKQSSASFNLEWDENKLWEQQRQQHNWFGYRVITGIRFQALHVYSQRTSKCRLNKSPEAWKRKVNWSTAQSTTERKQSAPSFTTTSSCPNLPRMLLSNCLWRFIRCFFVVVTFHVQWSSGNHGAASSSFHCCLLQVTQKNEMHPVHKRQTQAPLFHF